MQLACTVGILHLETLSPASLGRKGCLPNAYIPRNHTAHAQSPRKTRSCVLLFVINQAWVPESLSSNAKKTPNNILSLIGWKSVFSRVWCALSLGSIESLGVINQSQMFLTEANGVPTNELQKKNGIIYTVTHTERAQITFLYLTKDCLKKIWSRW